MKGILSATFFVAALSGAAFASDAKVILQYEKMPTFSPHPTHRLVTIDELGEVVSTTSELNGDHTRVDVIAKLSDAVVERIQAKIDDVNARGKLIDEDADEPKCADGPAHAVSVLKGAKMKVIESWESCHTYRLNQGPVEQLSQIIRAFADL